MTESAEESEEEMPAIDAADVPAIAAPVGGKAVRLTTILVLQKYNSTSFAEIRMWMLPKGMVVSVHSSPPSTSYLFASTKTTG